MKKVLIFEAHLNQALAVAKFIKTFSNYKIVGVIEKNLIFNRKNYDEIIIEKFENINIQEYNYILPMGAYSTYKIISKYKKLEFQNSISFSESNLIVFNKPKMLNIAKNIDIPIPKTFYKKEEIDNFPIFYKENFENGGGIRGIANSLNEIPQGNNLIYQEYINTTSTYGVGFLALSGEILTYKIHKEIISYPKDGGSAIVVEEFFDERLLNYTKKLLKEINYQGWGLVEFKYCNKRDDFVFMEINGKFWASIEFILNSNPLFLNKLLRIKYKKSQIQKILFINRLFQYNILDIIKSFRYLKGSKILFESSLLYQILRKIVPNKIVLLLKEFIK